MGGGGRTPSITSSITLWVTRTSPVVIVGNSTADWVRRTAILYAVCFGPNCVAGKSVSSQPRPATGLVSYGCIGTK